jgi:hypothetical protein
MRCRKCGTEIADKALICFRCGAATTDPVFAPPSAAKRRTGRPNLLVTVLALGLLAMFALYMGRAAAGQTPRLLSWAVAAIAAIIVLLRVYARRR